MRHLPSPLAAVGLAVLLVTAGCLGLSDATQSVSPPSDASTPTAPERSVSVAATGEASADPDRAVLHLAVQASADSAEAARSQVAENTSALRTALTEAGVDEANVTTERYNVREVKSRDEKGAPGPAEYRAVHALKVDVADVDRVGEFIGLAVRNGATDVRHVEFTLSEATESRLRERALSAAMSNARADADVLATEANLSIAGVHSVSTADVRVSPYRTETALAAGGDAGSATDVDSGPVTVTARVGVTYAAS